MTLRSKLAAAWTLAILVVCWTPGHLIDESRRGSSRLHLPVNFDKLVHLGIFAVFGVLAMRALASRSRAAKVFAAGLALAAISELGQMTPMVHRDAGLADGIADALGLALGVAAQAVVTRQSRPDQASGSIPSARS